MAYGGRCANASVGSAGVRRETRRARRRRCSCMVAGREAPSPNVPSTPSETVAIFPATPSQRVARYKLLLVFRGMSLPRSRQRWSAATCCVTVMHVPSAFRGVYQKPAGSSPKNRRQQNRVEGRMVEIGRRREERPPAAPAPVSCVHAWRHGKYNIRSASQLQPERPSRPSLRR